MNGKSIVVTGVSTGIGKAIVKILLAEGFRVFGSVRKSEDGGRLSAEFGTTFTPLIFDVRDEKAVAEAALRVKTSLGNQKLFGLVNNAGVAVAGPLEHLSIDSFRTQLDINLTGTLIVTQKFLPLLGTDRSRTGRAGRIVNISSIGGKFASPFMGPYSASKFALEGLSESLRREVQLFGIDVILVGPGAVATPIWDKVEQIDASPFAGTEYRKPLQKLRDYLIEQGRNGYPPEVVARVVSKALSVSRPRVRYSVVPHAFTGWFIPQLLTKRFIDKVFAKSLGLRSTHRNHESADEKPAVQVPS